MADALQRALFCKDIDQDFSLIAPAGVGKTYSIVERIFTLAYKQAEELPNLCVITYTRKAAETLKIRTLERLKQHKNFEKIFPFLQQSFFGTIHSLCWQHIQQLNPYKEFEILQDEAILREQFLSQLKVKSEVGKYVLRFVDEEILLNLASHLPPNNKISDVLKPPKNINLGSIYSYIPEPRNRIQIEQIKCIVEQWDKAYQTGDVGFLPECLLGGEKFKQCFYETFQPFYDHLGEMTLQYAYKLAQEYFNFRLENGYLKHADLVHLAQQYLHEEVGQTFFKERKFHFLLDEAQDTDADQFKYLLNLVEMRSDNRFSMVGDPQQSIYGTRSDIEFYLNVHEKRVNNHCWQELIFSDTYRCPKAIVQFLNEHFPKILDKNKDPKQVNYVPLQAVRTDWEGACVKITVPKNTTELSDEAFEVQQMAEFVQNFLKENQVLPSTISILAPRNDWLQAIAEGFKLHGLKLQLHSLKATGQDNALFCAVLAFIHLINFPNDTFELIGMMYGVFNIDEFILSQYASNIQLNMPSSDNGIVFDVLNQLYQLREEILSANLYVGTHQLISFFQNHCPDCDTDTIVIEILLEKAFKAEKEYRSWAYLESELRTYLYTTLEININVDKEAIQGFSCHKAKGLEWETVILPFVYRPIRPKPICYPYLYKDHIFWHKFNKPYELTADYCRELKRLFYVSCTRAQKNFFYLDDIELWPKIDRDYTFLDC